jgi:hypothetical protein
MVDSIACAVSLGGSRSDVRKHLGLKPILEVMVAMRAALELESGMHVLGKKRLVLVHEFQVYPCKLPRLLERCMSDQVR